MMWYLNISISEFEEMYPQGDISIFQRMPESDEDFVANFLPSKLWRLNNLYTIIDKDGNRIRFNMNHAQHVVYSQSLSHPRIIILKSRQQGISTFWLLCYFDDGLFIPDLSIGMLAQGLEEASTLLERVKTAWDYLPQAVKVFTGIEVIKDNSKEYAFSNGSTIFIRTSFRSATLQRLHVSEMGKIAAKDPQKARELVSGTMQTIKAGNPVVIESTAEGRKNQFYKMWYDAVAVTGERALKAFKPVFLSWVNDPDCVAMIPQKATSDDEAYFAKVEHDLDIKLSPEQKMWCIPQRAESGEDFDQEYPYSPESAFAAVRDGAYYARLWSSVGRTCTDLYEPDLDVYVSLDLGMDDTQVLVYSQEVVRSGVLEIRIIETYHNSGEDLQVYYDHMVSTGYRIAEVYIPHDSKVREWSSAKSRYRIMYDIGMRNLNIVPKASSVMADIEICRQALRHTIVDETCDYFLDMLHNYSKEWNDKQNCWRDKPLHDEWSNPADAFRMLVMGRYADRVGSPSEVKKKRRARRRDNRKRPGIAL